MKGRTEKVHSTDNIEIDCNFIQQQNLERSEKSERDLPSRMIMPWLTNRTYKENVQLFMFSTSAKGTDTYTRARAEVHVVVTEYLRGRYIT